MNGPDTDGARKPASSGRFFAGYLVDAVAPVAAYAVLHALGLPPLLAMLAGGTAAVLSTIANTIRRRKLDAFGVLVLVEIAVAIAFRNPRWLLIKPSLYSAVAGVFILASLFRGRPLTYEGSRPMATQGDPERSPAYDQAWERSPEFRALHRRTTAGLGIASLADALARVVIVETTSIDRAALLASVPHILAGVILVVVCAAHGRRSKELVEGELERMRAGEAAPAP